MLPLVIALIAVGLAVYALVLARQAAAMLRDEDDDSERWPDGCYHPVAERRSAATMGHPGRFFCLVCQTMIEPETADAS